ncbi:MAG TPA: CPBP family intramembrane glutamic endopeptidase, partial [Micropepsaceae bacterium]|nr:CPBP family intramembrane glutamic endopeptidase [Micropepsaceae bacterium]
MTPAALARVLYYLAVFLPLYACVFISPLWERRAVLQSPFKPWNALGLGTAIGGFAFLSVVLGLSLAGILQKQSTAQGFQLGMVLAAALTIFQAFGEEGFFRGWLQPIVAADWGPTAGLAVTAAIFAAAHAFAQVLGPIALLNIFLAGLVFGLLALRTGGLIAPFAAHWTWNWLEQSVMGLVPNPGVDSLGAFFDF